MTLDTEWDGQDEDLGLEDSEYFAGGGGDGMDPHDYAIWGMLVRLFVSPQLRTYDDFMPEGNYGDDGLLEEAVGDLVELGKVLEKAPANNRYAQLDLMREESDVLKQWLDTGNEPSRKNIEDSDITGSTRALLNYYSVMGWDRETVEKRLEDLRRRTEFIYKSILADERSGHFVDYGELRAKMSAGVKPEQIGSVVPLLPYPISRALTVSRGTENNTRRQHMQAAGAREIDYSGVPELLKLKLGAQGLMKKFKRRSSNSGGAPSDDSP